MTSVSRNGGEAGKRRRLDKVEDNKRRCDERTCGDTQRYSEIVTRRRD